jgi:hypothetical protein
MTNGLRASFYSLNKDIEEYIGKNWFNSTTAAGHSKAKDKTNYRLETWRKSWMRSTQSRT